VAFEFICSKQCVRMCSLLMRLQRSTSLFNFGCFAASRQHAEVNQKAQIAAAMQNVKWELRMKGLPLNRVFRTHSSSWPRATLSARVRQLRNVSCNPLDYPHGKSNC
jgi:hypothetical protein